MNKKVLLATRPLVPPWDEASKNFAYFLGREVREHELTLLTTPEQLSGLPETVTERPIFSSGHFGLKEKIEFFSALRKARHQYDVTHYLFTPTRTNTAIIRALAYPKRGKTVQTVATLREDLYSQNELRPLLFADRLIVYTDLTKQKLERLGFSNVTRIYPGIDLDLYQPRPKHPDTLRKLGFSDHHFIVIYPGEYTRLGATDMLTDAFIDFFQKHPDTDLRFVFACRVKNDADARKKASVEKRFTDAHVRGFISFTDTSTDMPALYNTADVVIFPVENLRGKFDIPLVIIEAYACGKPVILSDLPQFAEFANQDICVTIPKDSGVKLIESLAYLKQNKEKMIRLGENARRFAKDHFDLKNTAKQYEEIYTSL